MERAIKEFRRRFDGVPLVCGNVGTPMIVVPNLPARLGKWGDHYAGDFDFVKSTIALAPGRENDIVWREEFIVDVH